MKPAPFKYAAPETVAETLALLRTNGQDGKLLAGGQSLVPLLNMRLARPSVIIDLNAVRELSYIKEDNGEVVIGAMTRQREAELSPIVRRKLPLLAEALGYVGHPQIRNRGTIGGSIAHADPSAELPAVVAALGATMVVRGPHGRRALEPEQFFIAFLTTALQPQELLVEVRFPSHEKLGTAFVELARRHGDYALAGLAVTISRDGDAIKECRMAFTGVGPGPVRIPEAEAAVTGTRLTPQVLAEVRTIVSDRLDPDSDVHASVDYRKHVAGVLTIRALQLAYGRAAGTRPSAGSGHSTRRGRRP